ncbi:hypothetical protein BSK59_20130 [Paenibacillus odorifer]|uniref:response regulator n=1 Tax=Paenibacillus odorifer TaxID=189426 RepID=UPI00096CC3D8|nr:response regulator [Paenibacillus odorifer]OME51825.1 hypothetical protein BSK59_20130 [Paenibacillus odorifer]
MIKVLVVDDDKLVRKGLISMMPWQEFEMKVVGEASNGEKALQFLESNSVDLILTDLGMPVMSGIELMRVIGKRFPTIHVVVLSVHQDFEYVQEALRLGAIDYIAKVDLDLEKERLEDVLGRIADRMHGQTRSPRMPLERTLQRDGGLKQAFSVVILDHRDYRDWGEDLKRLADVKVIEVDRNNWLVLAVNGNEQDLFAELSNRIRLLQNVVLIRLSELQQFTLDQVQHWARRFSERELFYEYSPDNRILSVCIYKNYAGLHEQDMEGDHLEVPKELLLSGDWLHDDELFRQLIRQIKMFRVPQTRLIGLLYAFVNEWNRALARTAFGKIRLDETFHSWYQIGVWLEDTRAMIRHTARQTNYSPEIVSCVLKAEQAVRTRMDQPLTSAEVAKGMNMSRSYFSQCFKNIIGRTFKDYVREVRIEKAKQYLVHTNMTIQWIAEHTGYTDEKYFSRTFRELSGLLPSEYRIRKRIP